MGVDDRTPNVADGSAGANQKRKPSKFGFILIGLSFIMLLFMTLYPLTSVPFTGLARQVEILLGTGLVLSIPSVVISGLLYLILKSRVRKSFLDYFAIVLLVITTVVTVNWFFDYVLYINWF